MAECSEISLLIGPFEDGELEPHEMQEVARHLAACSSCEAILNDYGVIGRELRGATTLPPLDGFAQGVLARIGALPVPFRLRVTAWFDQFIGGISGTLAMGALAAAVAVTTAIIVTPYAQRQIASRTSTNLSLEGKTVARLESSAPAKGAATQVAATEGGAMMESGAEPPAMASPAFTPSTGNSHAIISRLESQIPSVALWSEPQNDTTVIWLPEQQP